jgi:putative ABC transport system permease protein
MTLMRFALTNLLRRPARTALTVLGIALAIGTAVALLALGRGITDSVARGLDEQGVELMVAQRGATDIFSARLPEAFGPRLAAVAGVGSVAAELYAFAAVEGGRQLLLAGWSDGSPAWERVPLAAGRLPRPGERELLLGDTLAAALSAGIGTRIELFDESFEVVGITRYATAMNRGLAVLPLAALQAAALRPGQVTAFAVRVAPGAERGSVAAAIAAALPVTVSDTTELLEGDRNVAILRAVSRAVSVVALAMGALSLLGTLLMSVQERTREIGMIAAMGWSDGRIVALIVLEGLQLGIAGCIGGIAVGLGASALFGAIPAIGDFVAFTPSTVDLALPLLLALPVCAAGAAYPAWRSVRLMPAEALRRA